MFIPAHSAHPAGCTKGLVFSQLRRFWLQNSDIDAFTAQTAKFYHQLLRRGHNASVLEALFMEAAERLDAQPRPTNMPYDMLSRWPTLRNDPTQVSGTQLRCIPPKERTNQNGPRTFLHLRYHPQLPSRQVLQSLFKRTLSKVLPDDHRLTIAFARAPNLGDRLWRTRLTTNENDTASNILSKIAGPTPV